MDYFSYVCDYNTELTKPLIRVFALGTEFRQGTEYYFDNKNRMDNGYMFQYTFSGSGYLEVGNKKYLVDKGKAMFLALPSDTKYYHNPDSHEAWSFAFIHFQSSVLEEYYQTLIKKTSPFMSLSEDAAPIRLLSDIINQVKSGYINSFNVMSAKTFEFVCSLYDHFINNHDNYSHRTKEVINTIERNFAHLESIESLAASMGITPSHLSREFAQDTGISPIAYLTQVRIGHARHLLRSTNLSINEIATQCGYSQCNYFCKVFREKTGQTPLNYRNLPE